MSNIHSNVAMGDSEAAMSVTTNTEMSVEEYKQWVDAVVCRAESIEKARQHAPSKIIRRSSLQTITATAEKKEAK